MMEVLEMLKKPEVIAVFAFVVEMAMRFVKTEKPWSVMHLVKRCLRVASQACGVVADFLDKILPQKLDDPKL